MVTGFRLLSNMRLATCRGTLCQVTCLSRPSVHGTAQVALCGQRSLFGLATYKVGKKFQEELLSAILDLPTVTRFWAALRALLAQSVRVSNAPRVPRGVLHRCRGCSSVLIAGEGLLTRKGCRRVKSVRNSASFLRVQTLHPEKSAHASQGLTGCTWKVIQVTCTVAFSVMQGRIVTGLSSHRCPFKGIGGTLSAVSSVAIRSVRIGTNSQSVIRQRLAKEESTSAVVKGGKAGCALRLRRAGST
mmetsp:Transcript_42399/g.105958  ORF Transcript_42399/g.105958 Transcript_42399/m.105958 type:complete len:245 (+) Transcript_42399:1374-2108(+)